jgi:hypothetical protein
MSPTRTARLKKSLSLQFIIFLNKFYCMMIDKVYVFISVIVISSVLLWVSSCRHDALIPSNIPEICFEKEVLPIFQNNCAMAGCHDGTGELESFNNYVNISHGVTAGNPNSSNLYQVIISKWAWNRMPPKNPLSLENRTIIRLWIEQGARLTVCVDSSLLAPVPPSFSNPRACFSRDVLPVVVSSCGMAGCHDAISHNSGYIFASYSTTLNSVRPGSPTGSKLYQVITASGGGDRMPPSPRPRLTQPQIDSISAWIRYGALNEACGEVCDTINPVTFSASIWPTIQTSCTGCHSGATPSGAILLASYANVQTVAASGLLMKSLTGNGVIRMPPSGSLSSCKIRQFQIWVNNGYLNN